METQREKVLAAIMRAAEGNGRSPLGEKTFYSETNLKLTDLHYAGFPNYGAAVEAAGYTRNTLKQAFSDSQLFAPLAELVRRLDRIPTTNERVVARKQDATFPSNDAYARRSKIEPLNVALLKWCRSNESFADVVSILERNGDADFNEIKRARRKRNVNGYIYLMRYGANGKAYKVGRSENVVRRHAQIANMIPDDLRYIHVIPTDDPKGIEAYWKERFASRRIKGKNEIFHLTAEDIAAFKSRDYQ